MIGKGLLISFTSLNTLLQKVVDVMVSKKERMQRKL